MATIKAEFYDFNGVSWDLIHFKTTMEQVEGLTSALAGKLDKRTGIVQSEAMTPDTQALFPYALTTASTVIGMEYNILLYAYKKGYTITQSGTGQIAGTHTLFDGRLEPNYSPDGINPADPFVLLIEGLPNIHSQSGGMIGWTARYWFPRKYKVEVYDSYNSVGWRTLVDQSSVAKPTKDLVIPLYPTYSGAHTKIRITIYEAAGSAGANGYNRWGLSEIFFIHPEAQAVHQYLDVEWAKKFSTARAIQIGNTSKNFDGSANLAWTVAEIGAHPNTWNPSLLSVYRGYASALDTTFIPGYYYVNNSTTGQPNSSQFGWLHVEVNNNANYDGATNWIRQSFQQTDGKKYYRTRINASSWSPWYQEYNSQFKPTPAEIGAMPTYGGTFTDDVTIDTTSGSLIQNSKNLIFKYNRGSVGGGITQKSLYVDSSGDLRYDGAAISFAGHTHAISDVTNLRSELDNALNVGNPTMKFNTSTAYTLVLADKGTTIFNQASGATTITIPNDASVAFPNGTEINVVKYNSHEVTIGYASGVGIYSEGSSTINAGKRRINAEYQAVTLKKVSTNVWILIGALKS